MKTQEQKNLSRAFGIVKENINKLDMINNYKLIIKSITKRKTK